jgi:hypothetical protein
MVLSKFESAKSSTMKSQSRIRTKLEAKSTIRAKILDKSAIRCINKFRKSVKIFARSEIRTIFYVKSDDPKSYLPPPPPPCCLVILLTSVSTISYAESNGGIFVHIGRTKPEIRQSPRLIRKKTFLEKRNSGNMKGLF